MLNFTTGLHKTGLIEMPFTEIENTGEVPREKLRS